VLLNRLRFPTSIHLRGTVPVSAAAGAPIAPGETVTWDFYIPNTAGPSSKDKSSVAYIYQADKALAAQAAHRLNTASAGSVAPAALANFADFNAGLFGTLIVSKESEARWDASPGDVNQEFSTVFATINENLSPYLDININKFALEGYSVVKSDPIFKASNERPSINGVSFCNLGGLVMMQSRVYRWYAMALGGEAGVHAPTWSGQTISTVRYNGNGDAVELLPGSSKVADIKAYNAGVWLLEDQALANSMSGARALFKITIKVTSVCPMKFWAKC